MHSEMPSLFDCAACGETSSQGLLLNCDKCYSAYHVSCIGNNFDIPDEILNSLNWKWICPGCLSSPSVYTRSDLQTQINGIYDMLRNSTLAISNRLANLEKKMDMVLKVGTTTELHSKREVHAQQLPNAPVAKTPSYADVVACAHVSQDGLNASSNFAKLTPQVNAKSPASGDSVTRMIAAPVVHSQNDKPEASVERNTAVPCKNKPRSVTQLNTKTLSASNTPSSNSSLFSTANKPMAASSPVISHSSLNSYTQTPISHKSSKPPAVQNVVTNLDRGITGSRLLCNKPLRLRTNVPRSNSQCKIFISRLHPDTTPEEVFDYISEVTKMAPVITKLRTKYPSYSSFSIDFPTSTQINLNDPTLWPAGALVMKYRGKRSFINSKKPVSENVPESNNRLS